MTVRYDSIRTRSEKDLWRFTSSDFKRWWLNGVNWNYWFYYSACSQWNWLFGANSWPIAEDNSESLQSWTQTPLVTTSETETVKSRWYSLRSSTRFKISDTHQ